MQLQVETVNANSVGTFKKRILESSAHVVLGQELHLSPAHIDEFVAWATRHGWRVLAEPAIPKSENVDPDAAVGGYGTGGVCVAARDMFGLRPPEDLPKQVAPGRAIEAIVDLPGYPPCHFVSVYAECAVGVAGNAALLEAVGERCQRRSDQLLIAGGDWNVEPGDISASGFPRQARVAVVCTGEVTCRSALASSEYDFFVLSQSAARLLKTVQVSRNANITPHSPVCLGFHANGLAMRHLTFAAPPPLPRDLPVGPVTRPWDWVPVRSAVETATRLVGQGGPGASGAVDRAWKWFANAAEGELASRLGVDLKRPGRRGGRCRAQWVDTVPKVTKPTKSIAASWRWLLARIHEFQRLVRSGDDAADGPAHVELCVAAAVLEQTQVAGMGEDHEFDLAVATLKQRVAEVLVGHARSQGGAVDEAEDGEVWPDLVRSAEASLEQQLSIERKASEATWKEWVESTFEKGCRGMHKFSRVQLPWTACTTLQSDGQVTADPRETLAAATKELQS